MNQHHVLLMLMLGLLLGACASPFDEDFYEREFEAYLPSEDPLVLAHFERALNDNNIAYRRDAEGRFSVIDHRQDDDMEDIADEFNGKAIPRRGIEVQAGCAVQAAQTYLRREDVVFVLVTEEDITQLQMRESDYVEHEMEQRWDAFRQACAEQSAS